MNTDLKKIGRAKISMIFIEAVIMIRKIKIIDLIDTYELS